ncbi:MAG: RusA family crossover junction endodeoxyribonuclease [Eggerthia catenaformis]|uniref:RusA family crossover junction endodeoxyribonuclease n=1 Tax=Eggerthia catenaformis TaxID=31973 RepID=UPI003FA0034A
MIKIFTIPGEPKGKARHRITKSGIAYIPKQTTSYENWVKQCYLDNYEQTDSKAEISVHITCFFAPPKSVSKKKKQMMLDHQINVTKKPDCDNIAKIILDSLNKIAYYDDSQIVDLHVSKQYDEIPHVAVVIEYYD